MSKKEHWTGLNWIYLAVKFVFRASRSTLALARLTWQITGYFPAQTLKVYFSKRLKGHHHKILITLLACIPPRISYEVVLYTINMLREKSHSIPLYWRTDCCISSRFIIKGSLRLNRSRGEKVCHVETRINFNTLGFAWVDLHNRLWLTGLNYLHHNTKVEDRGYDKRLRNLKDKGAELSELVYLSQWKLILVCVS